MDEQVNRSRTKPITVHRGEVASRVRPCRQRLHLRTKDLRHVGAVRWCVGVECMTGAMAKRTDQMRIDSTR